MLSVWPFQQRLDRLTPGSVVLLGAPYDANASFLRGAAFAPAIIRQALHSPAGNWSLENDRDLEPERDWCDLGDLSLPAQPGPLEALSEVVLDLRRRGLRLFTLGGDHSITYAILRAYAQFDRPLTVLQLDAHPDLYPILEGNPYSHACPFARLLEEGVIHRLVQVGIRAAGDVLRQQAARFGVEMISMADFSEGLHLGAGGLELTPPLYLSLDMDVLDPAFAPGVSHPEGGGLSVRQVVRLLHTLHVPLVGADLVEFNPLRDSSGITAAAAVKLSKEVLGLLRRSSLPASLS